MGSNLGVDLKTFEASLSNEDPQHSREFRRFLSSNATRIPIMQINFWFPLKRSNLCHNKVCRWRNGRRRRHHRRRRRCRLRLRLDLC